MRGLKSCAKFLSTFKEKQQKAPRLKTSQTGPGQAPQQVIKATVRTSLVSDIREIKCLHRAQRTLKDNTHPPDSLLTLLPSREIQCEFLSEYLLLYDQTMEQLLSSDCETIPFCLSVQFFINSLLILYQFLFEKSRPTGVFSINTTFSPLTIFDPQHTDGRVSVYDLRASCSNSLS